MGKKCVGVRNEGMDLCIGCLGMGEIVSRGLWRCCFGRLFLAGVCASVSHEIW